MPPAGRAGPKAAAEMRVPLAAHRDRTTMAGAEARRREPFAVPPPGVEWRGIPEPDPLPPDGAATASSPPAAKPGREQGRQVKCTFQQWRASAILTASGFHASRASLRHRFRRGFAAEVQYQAKSDIRAPFRPAGCG